MIRGGRLIAAVILVTLAACGGPAGGGRSAATPPEAVPDPAPAVARTEPEPEQPPVTGDDSSPSETEATPPPDPAPSPPPDSDPSPPPNPAPSPPATLATWASARLSDRDVAETPAPTLVAIPALGLEAEVVALGVEEGTGLMEVPDDIAEVGWYRHGPVPGAAGSSVLAAHVDMAGAGPGAFYDLDLLAAGDVFEVSFADGSGRTFEVVSTFRIPKEQLDVDELFASDGEAVVRLVTCGGAFNETERSYHDNVVVTATEVEA